MNAEQAAELERDRLRGLVTSERLRAAALVQPNVEHPECEEVEGYERRTS